MPEQPSPHHDQPPADHPEEGSVPIELTPEKKLRLIDVLLGDFFNQDSDGGYFDQEDVRNDFPLSNEKLNSILSDSRVQDIVKESLIRIFEDERDRKNKETKDPILLAHYVYQSGYREAQRLLKDFPIPQEKVQEAINAELSFLLLVGRYAHVRELLAFFPIPQEKVREAVKETLIKMIASRRINEAKKLLEMFPLSEEIVQEALPHLILNEESSDFGISKEFIEFFHLSEKILEDATRVVLISLFQRKRFDRVRSFMKAFNISRDEKLRVALQYSGVSETDVTQEGEKAFEKSEHPDPYVQHAGDF